MGMGTKLLKTPHPPLHTAPCLVWDEMQVEQVGAVTLYLASFPGSTHESLGTRLPCTHLMEEMRLGTRLYI